MKKLLFLFLGCIMFTACSEKDPLSEADAGQEFSDEEIFEGLFLGRGDFATNLTVIDGKYIEEIYSKMSKEDLKKVEDFKSTIIKVLNDKDPSILSSFSKGIQSGDPYVVSESFNSFYEEYFQALKTIPEFEKTFSALAKNDHEKELKDYLKENGEIDKERFLKDIELEKTNLTPQEQKVALPVACFTLIVWNAGVVVNVAAAVNAVVGVNVAMALNAVVGVNVAVSGTNNYLEEDPGRQAEFVSKNGKTRLSEELISEIIFVTQ